MAPQKAWKDSNGDILHCSSVDITVAGEPFHSVALDEAHEMCVKKDLKAAVSCPTKSYLQKTTFFILLY